MVFLPLLHCHLCISLSRWTIFFFFGKLSLSCSDNLGGLSHSISQMGIKMENLVDDDCLKERKWWCFFLSSCITFVTGVASVLIIRAFNSVFRKKVRRRKMTILLLCLQKFRGNFEEFWFHHCRESQPRLPVLFSEYLWGISGGVGALFFSKYFERTHFPKRWPAGEPLTQSLHRPRWHQRTPEHIWLVQMIFLHLLQSLPILEPSLFHPSSLFGWWWLCCLGKTAVWTFTFNKMSLFCLWVTKEQVIKGCKNP